MAKRRKRQTIKQLESQLQDLYDFEVPKVNLEQYATPPHIAALMLNTIDLTYYDIEDKFVADLGCGTARLSIGSLLCGASMVYGFDIDREALECGLRNVHELYGDDEDESDCNDRETIASSAYKCCERFNFIQADIASTDYTEFWGSMSKKFDTVIMNPPFGTKQTQGLDMLFLQQAINLADNVVYSLHKSSTREVSCFLHVL